MANPPDYLWYACYGSNLRRDRFQSYLVGGQVPDGEGCHFGSVDQSLPRIDWPYLTEWELHFAHHSTRWGAGVAFLVEPTVDVARPRTPHEAVGAGAMCRLYKLSFDQFVDVLIQGNDGNPHASADARERTRSVVAAGVKEAGACGGFLVPDEVLPDGWYRRLVTLGERGGTPILSFTVVRDVAFNAPSGSYLKTIVLGLLETYPQLTPDQIVAYLKRTS